MTPDALIDALLEREGGFRAAKKRPDGSFDPPTNYGITATTWGGYRQLNRPATVAEVKAITREQAVAFYQRELAQSPFGRVVYAPLQAQLFDFGENSGTARAIRWLQRVLRVPVTGVMDERTTTALAVLPQFLVHEALIGARVRMIRGAVTDGSIDASDEAGLLNRALAFTEIRTE